MRALLGVLLVAVMAPAAHAAFTCPRDRAYWRDNPARWPVQSVVVGDPANAAHHYGQPQALALLANRSSDASVTLAKQLIAVRLNFANGSDPAPIASVVAQADALLVSYPGSLPYAVGTTSAAGKSMAAKASRLGAYNSGYLTKGCGVPPIASAGADQSVPPGSLVQLDGTGSRDPDGGTISYAWTFVSRPGGSSAAFTKATGSRPKFTADREGEYRVRLVVRDAKSASEPDEVLITAGEGGGPANRPPLANAGADVGVAVGSEVLLSGLASSDPDSDPLAFAWRIVAAPTGSAAGLAGAASATAQLSPDLPGTYTVELTVTDPAGLSATDSVTVTAVTGNRPPVANAGPDQVVTRGDTVQLTGAGSRDPDQDPLTYRWTLAVRPAGSAAELTGATGAAPAFVADAGGTYVAELVVRDGLAESTPDSVEIVAAVPPNRAPQITSAPVVSGLVGAAYRYDAQASDPDEGDTLVFSLAAAPEGMAIDPATGLISWTPAEEQAGSQAVTVRVEDAAGLADTQSFEVLVALTAGAPVARDDTYSTRVGETLTVSAPGVLLNDSDPNDDALAARLVSGPRSGELAFNPDGSFSYTPRAVSSSGLPFEPVVKFQAVPGTAVNATPLVANLTDDNGDGRIDTRDTPDIVFVSRENGQFGGGPLRAISGDDGHAIFTVAGPNGLAAYGEPAIGDIDGDGLPEIVAANQAGTALRAFEHDGTPKWTSTVANLAGRSDSGGVIAIANADAEGLPEIIVGDYVYDADGVLRGRGRLLGGTTGFTLFTVAASVADIDLDGRTEIVAGPTAYRYAGGELALAWRAPGLPDGFSAIGNFDGDPFAEIVIVGTGQVYMLNHDGTLAEVWNPPTHAPVALPGGGFGGAPTIGDFDGDGLAEIGIAGASRYVVFEADGSVRWQSPTQDASSSCTGSTLFDFDRDGNTEVVYRDEVFLRVYRGGDGTVLLQVPMGSGTGTEQPVVADVDNDGHAEILTTSEGGSTLGLWVFEDAQDRWVGTRRIWNQHAYHITNVNEDGTIPRVEQANWLQPGLNNFRLNDFLPGESSADSFTYVASDGTTDSNVATVSVAIRPPNTGPTITSTAVTAAATGIAYAYAAAATDPDTGDTLTWSLAAAPEGMTIDGATGVVSWVPQAGQLGGQAVTLRVLDAAGFADTQAFTVTAVASTTVPNVAGGTPGGGSCPLLGAQPTLLGPTPYLSFDDSPFQGLPFNYFHLETVQDAAINTPGLSLDPASGGGVTSVIFGPNIHDSVDADDGAINGSGLSGDSVFGGGPTGLRFRFDGTVLGALPTYAGLVWTDGNGASMYFDAFGPSGELIGSSGPVPLTSQSNNGETDEDRFFGITSASGISAIRMRNDSGGIEVDHVQYGRCDSVESALAAAGLVLGELAQAGSATVPAGQIISQSPPAGTVVPVGTAVHVVVSTGPDPADVDDDGDGFSERAGDCDDADPARNPGATDVPGNGIDEDCSGSDATPPPPPPDPLTVDDDGDGLSEAQGDCNDANPAIRPGRTDIAGNGIDEDCNGRDAVAGDDVPPVAVIEAPADLAVVTQVTDVTGTATDTNFARYTLALAPAGSTTFVTFASGTSAVSGGTLGRLDPTLLENGLYMLRLVAEDANGRTAIAERVYQVDGMAKIGNFRLSFTDLQVPLAGIPITVTRTYDSRVKTREDFGVGWTLGVRRGSLRHDRTPGLGWQVLPGRFGFPCQQVSELVPHLTEVRLSDREAYTFALTVSLPAGLTGGCEVTTGFRFVKGRRPGATLQILDGTQALYLNGDTGIVDPETFLPYEPRRVRLRTPEGRAIDLELGTGITRIQDENGNAVTIGSAGIVHSSGASIAFLRDGQGRITRITDPAGRALQYRYDAAGDLREFLDQAGNLTTFAYDQRHLLVEIRDPLGNRAVRSDYDADGRLVSVTDASGNAISYAHDLAGRQETVTDRLGHTTLFEYDERGNVVRRTDALGDVTTAGWDARDNKLFEIDPLGRITSYTYDANNNLLTMTDPLGAVTTRTYDARNQETSWTDPRGGTTLYAYDSRNNLLAITDPLGNVTSHTYDARGLRLSTTDPLGAAWSYAYDSRGRQVRATDPLGAVTTRTFDASGNKLTEVRTREVDGATETLAWRFDYDALNRPVREVDAEGSVIETRYTALGDVAAITDPRGGVTAFAYDALARRTEITWPDGAVVRAGYDAGDRRVASTDEAGRTTRYAYDPLGRLIETIHPDGTATRAGYDAAGQRVRETDELGNETTRDFDAAGRPTGLRDALGNLVRFGYDAAGNLASIVDARGSATVHEYDAANRRTRVIFADGTVQATGYDAAGRVVATTDPAGLETRFAYDAVGRLLGVTDALGQVTRYAYDAAGQPLAQTDAAGRVTRFRHDGAGRRTQRTLPLGQVETMSYDAAGNLVERRDFAGRVTRFEYDARNRLVGRIPDAGTAETFAYTPTGLRSRMTDAGGTTTYAYDARERLVEMATPRGTLAYGYDAAGRLASIRSSNGGGTSVDYGWDAAGRLRTVADNRSGAITTYDYDPAGNVSRVAMPNGVDTAYVRDALGRITDVTITGGGATLARFAYTLGPAGNRLAAAESGGRRVDWQYDGLYRLARETISGDPDPALNGTVAYTYDPVGNRLARTSTVTAVPSATYAYDANDRLIGDDYDANGNTLARGGRSFAYDFENRLVGIDGGAVTFTYDGDGNRVARTAGGVTTQFLVDGLNPTGYAQVLEELGTGGVGRVYGFGREILGQAGDGTGATWFGRDALGSIRLLTGDAGGVVARRDYDAFGAPVRGSAGVPGAYGFAGERQDDEAGLVYLRARYMDPGSGRFLTTDPHPGEGSRPVTLHDYLYARGSPVDNTDPSGRFSLAATAVSVAIAGTLVTIGATVYGANVEDDPGAGGDVSQRSISTSFGRVKELQVESEFIREFESAVAEEYQRAGSVASGWPNNVCASVGAITGQDFGQGCGAWQDWIISWFNTEQIARARRVPNWDYIKVTCGRTWAGAFNHQFAFAELPILGRLVLDPWRNWRSPIWSESLYAQEFDLTLQIDTACEAP